MTAKKGNLTRLLTIIGTVLVWLPLLAPLILGLVSWSQDGIFRFDYLIPAELFPVTILGGVVLIWAAARANSHIKWISVSLVSAIALLVLDQGIAVVSGLAHGETTGGAWLVVVLTGLALFAIADLVLAVGGASLLYGLFKRNQPA